MSDILEWAGIIGLLLLSVLLALLAAEETRGRLWSVLKAFGKYLGRILLALWRTIYITAAFGLLLILYFIIEVISWVAHVILFFGLLAIYFWRWVRYGNFEGRPKDDKA